MDEQGFFRAHDGTSIYFECRGPKSAPALLLCYGLLCRKEHWRHQVEYFEKKYRVIRFDYRGHQLSSIPENPHALTVDWCARDALAVIEGLGIKKFSALGHSFGVPVLAELANLAPEKIDSIVFLCGAAHNPFDQMFFTDKMNPVFDLASNLFHQFPELGQQVWNILTQARPATYFLTRHLGFNSLKADKEDVLSYMQGVRETRSSVFYALLKDYKQKDRRELLKKIQAPALIIAGDRDLITPVSVQKQMGKLLPNSEFHAIAGGSHNTHVDFADTVNGIMEAFFQRIHKKKSPKIKRTKRRTPMRKTPKYGQPIHVLH